MDFRKMLSTMTQLNEAKEVTKPGVTKVTGTYGKEYDAGDDGSKKKPASDVKKGRGRPKKDADETGEVKKYDTSSLGNVFGGGKKPSKPVGKVSKKNTLKDWFERLDKAIVNEAGLSPSQTMVPGMQAGGNTAQPTIIDVKNNPALKAALDKAAQQKQITTVGIPQTGASSTQQKPGQAQTSAPMGANNQPAMAEGEDEGKPGKNFAKIAKSAGARYGSKAAGERVAGAVRAKLMKQGKLEEADRPTHDGDEGANLGAGRNPYVLEAKKDKEPEGTYSKKRFETDGQRVARLAKEKRQAEKKKSEEKVEESAKPDYIDLDKDGDKKEPMKKAAQDAKKKTKVKEGMDHRLKAAHHAGKSHALSKQGYNCAYDDMEESRCYHEGYKEGLDECYGQMPIQGYVGETGQSTVDDMASFGAHTPTMEDDMEEGNAFTKKLATTPAGGSFSLGGKSFKDTSNYDSSVFESWDNELNSLLEEYDAITEGITVSSSQGQSNQPDSVSVTASDSDAQQLMQVLRSAGIGGFGGGETQGHSDDMTVDTGEPEEIGTGGAEIDVVDDHGNMMDLIRKVTGGAPKGPEQGFGGSDDEEEEHEHGEEETCDACGSADCECDDEESGEEQQVDEVESEDQMEYEVAEDNAPDSGATEEAEEVADTQQANQSAAEYDAAQDEEQVEESYANGADDTFEADIAYMTKVISGGLNKEKSTGQTTIPVIAGQGMRTGVTESKQLNESVNDWKKLAGIK
jgi:hypothetical protein